MSRSVVPRVIERYVFVRLLGSRDAGYCSDYDDDATLKAFLDPLEMLDRPSDGLFHRLRTALRESAEYAEKLADLQFDCPHCGNCSHCHPEDQPFIEHLQLERSRANSTAESLRREIELLERLIDPDQMGDAYVVLASEFTTDKQWFDFIESARNARQDFSEYRRIHKKASKLLSEVSVMARQLALLLVELQKTNVRLPVELESPERNFDDFFGPQESQEAQRLEILRLVERARSNGAASSSPPLDLRRTLLDVSKIAGQLPVDFACPEVEAAIATRQDSKKSAYFRAFGALLAEANIKLSVPVTRAMAITANVILDDPDLSVSEDTVRKVLKRSQTRQHKKKGPQETRTRTTRSRVGG